MAYLVPLFTMGEGQKRPPPANFFEKYPDWDEILTPVVKIYKLYEKNWKSWFSRFFRDFSRFFAFFRDFFANSGKNLNDHNFWTTYCRKFVDHSIERSNALVCIYIVYKAYKYVNSPSQRLKNTKKSKKSLSHAEVF